MSEVQQPLNIAGLARSAPGQGHRVPGTPLEVSSLRERSERVLEAAQWLLVLEGELIVDLPHGDFRLLKQGHSLHLPAGLAVALEPVEETVLLTWVDR